jgi:hypothetical protein
MQFRVPAAQCARGFALPSAQRGRGERRMPAAPAASCALCIGRKHTSIRVHRNHPAFPHAMVLTAYVELSPVTGLFCHRRLRICFVQARLGRRNSADLTPASGCQDHTILPYAATSLVRSLGDRSREHKNPPCDPIARKTLPRPHPLKAHQFDRGPVQRTTSYPLQWTKMFSMTWSTRVSYGYRQCIPRYRTEGGHGSHPSSLQTLVLLPALSQ